MLTTTKPQHFDSFLTLLDGLPPDRDKSTEWQKAKKDWQYVKFAIQHYFSGTGNFEEIRRQARDPDLLEVGISYFAALYDIIYFGWGEIERYFKGVDLASMGFSCPADLARGIFHGYAELHLQERKSPTAPRSLYDLWGYTKKIEGIKALREPTKEEQKKLAALQKRVYGKSWKIASELDMLRALLYEALSKGRESTKRRLKNLQAWERELCEVNMKRYSPRNYAKRRRVYKT